MTSLSIAGVGKTFGDSVILRGVDLVIQDGQFVVLVGPSGCGKSTLLRMIAGLEEISVGSISIGGRVVNDVPAKDRDIAMVFQNYALYPHMSVAENMGFSLRLKKIPRNEVKARVAHAAEILGLGALLQRRPRDLSGGQRQRVAMGRAIVRDPKVFLFDEPLSNLDAKLRMQMRSEIKELHRRLRTTTVYVTHDQMEAMTMADRIVVMHGGAVEQEGSPLEVYDRPANVFVAGFIGSPAMNLLAGRVTEAGFALDGGGMLPLAAIPAGSLGLQAVYGIRPEHLGMGDGTAAEVILVESTGAETHVVAKIGAVTVTSIVRGRLAVEVGGTIALRPDPAQIHLFAGDSGLRLN